MNNTEGNVGDFIREMSGLLQVYEKGTVGTPDQTLIEEMLAQLAQAGRHNN